MKIYIIVDPATNEYITVTSSLDMAYQITYAMYKVDDSKIKFDTFIRNKHYEDYIIEEFVFVER